MPVTIRTQPLDGEPWRKATTSDAAGVLRATFGTQNVKADGLMRSSLDSDGAAVTPSANGLVDAAIEAWNGHHHLVLRPDDVWLAVVSQLGFFINAHADEMRDLFVAHQEGQKELEVEQIADSPDTADYGAFATSMAAAVAANLKDPDLAPWLLPAFSTTTDADRAAGAVLLMGAMQQYFRYAFNCVTCGIPSVTLLGERADWADLAARIDRVGSLGGEAVEFRRLLVPLARHMVRSFDEPASDAVVAFWRAVASRERPRYRMSGGPGRYLSGWIGAFCFWTARGERNRLHGDRNSACVVDGVRYFPLDPDDKVAGWASVPVKVRWVGGDGAVVEERRCRMVAGSVGLQPGRHADLGVVLDGLPVPPREGEEGGEGKGKGDDSDENYGRPETAEERRARWVQEPTEPQPGAPPASAGLDAVQPRIAWWIFEEK